MFILTSRADCTAGTARSRAGLVGLYLIAFALCAAGVVQSANTAWAQCAARDVVRNQLMLKIHSPVPSQLPVKSAREAATWKTITIGTFAGSTRLRDELDAMGCHVGAQASEILARPTFAVASHKTDVELVVVTPAQLGFASDTVSLAEVYARARQLGFELAAAEVGPQLRIQYFDQPVGEFLIIAMEPIVTWRGEPMILNVANGGAGLTLIGQDGGAGAQIRSTARLVFARSRQPAPSTELLEQTAASLPP